MNGLGAAAPGAVDGIALADALRAKLAAGPAPRAEVAVFPPATLIARVAWKLAGSAIALGGQDCHAAQSGAHTGDVSAAMLKDAGCRYVILGHSERRADHGETDAEVRAKSMAAIAAGLVPLICVGESEAERRAGKAEIAVARQLAGSLPPLAEANALVVAYEPVWAIGSGRTPSEAEIAAMHGFIRTCLSNTVADPAAQRILYGGSVKAENAAIILRVPDVDGALVGGASLDAGQFWAIVQAAP